MFDHDFFFILVNVVQINLSFGELCSVLVSSLQGVVGKSSEIQWQNDMKLKGKIFSGRQSGA